VSWGRVGLSRLSVVFAELSGLAAWRAPCKLGPDVVAKVLAGKLVEDSTFRATAINTLKYFFGRGDVGARMLSRFLRRSY